MSLTKKQIENARRMHQGARQGDTGAQKFWHDIEAMGGPLWEEYRKIRDGENPGGGKKAYLDADSSLLMPKQLQTAITQALMMKDGDEGALRFYALMVKESQNTERPNPQAAQFVAVMNEVRDKDGKGVNIYQKPGSAAAPAGQAAPAGAQGVSPGSMEDLLRQAKKSLENPAPPPAAPPTPPAATTGPGPVTS